jgi:hypothetical protein
MKTLHAVLFALGSLLAVSATAEAVDLWTMPLFVEPGHTFQCRVTNISLTKNVPVQLAIYSDGTVDNHNSVTLNPLETITIDPLFPNQNYHFTCRFTVSSTTLVRAGATIFAHTGDETDQVAVTAQ